MKMRNSMAAIAAAALLTASIAAVNVGAVEEAPAKEETVGEVAETVEETVDVPDQNKTESSVDLSALDGEVIYGETATSNGEWGQAISLRTLKNEGGVFDPSILTDDKVVVVYYEADTAPEVVLQSWSGGAGWAKVPANEEYSSEGVAVFTYDNMVAMYEADNFEETLDCFIVGDTGSALTVNKVLLVDVAALSGAPAETVEKVEEAPAETEEVVEETVEEVGEAPVEVPEDTAETVAEVVVETAPETPATTETTPAKTGNASAAALAAVMAVAGAAIVASRRK